MNLYVNHQKKIICETVKEINCPDVSGIGKIESEYKGVKELQAKMFVEKEGFRKVTTKEFRDLLKAH
ncbi:hypothetical protein BC351_00525 [Paenibacillus ferrarius]|uniref:Uncharacterized protein n=1 Tax=Paenibacillus ferrarius TaxID=1469647 RepID=A0A1V4HS57_9BACL|nr:hypothetical protein [Paenibacillus ferrarius]OPH61761.1 hypothetical protein BC351_00525 [Paenibacillus ferrarius]